MTDITRRALASGLLSALALIAIGTWPQSVGRAQDHAEAGRGRGHGHDSGGGHDTGGEHDTGEEHDDCGSGDDCGGSHEDGDHGSSGGRGRRAGRGEGRGHGSGGSVRDIFRSLDDSEAETRRGSVRGGPVGGGGHE